MIPLRLFTGEGETEQDLGVHTFLALPRAGERVLAFIDGRNRRLMVEEVLHWPSTDNGPIENPSIWLRVAYR